MHLMTNISKDYTLFSLLVLVTICMCIYVTLAQVVRRRQNIHLRWIIPMAVGYTLSAIMALLYALDPRYWGSLAHAGSYPLLIIGVISGLLMVYGWVRFAMIFFSSNTASKILRPLSVGVDAHKGVWPPPPERPKEE